LFDFLTSTKRPASGTPVLPAAQVIERLKVLPLESFELILLLRFAPRRRAG
jgi:hypothetical protein